MSVVQCDFISMALGSLEQSFMLSGCSVHDFITVLLILFLQYG